MRTSDVPEGLDRQFRAVTHQAPQFVGLTADDACRLATQEGVEKVRLLSLDGKGGMRIHQDRRPDRLNLLVLHGTVVRAGFF
jgi:hypothetical protein